MQDLSNRAEQVIGLKNGKGIQYLLNEAHRVLGHSILIHDMEYKAIALSENVITDDPIWNEYADKGTVGHEWLDFFKNECFLEAAANTKTITFLTSDKLKYDRIYGKIFNQNNIQVGCAVMMACDRPFEDNDPILFEAFCDILTTELSAIDFYTDYGQAYFEQLVDELIVGVDDKALYAAHVESIYMHLKSNLYLAVVDIGDCDPAQLASFRDLLKKTQPEYMYAAHGNHILIIIGTDAEALSVEKELNQLDRLFRERNIYAGISSAFENLFDLNRYYKEALACLNNGLEAKERHIFLHE